MTTAAPAMLYVRPYLAWDDPDREEKRLRWLLLVALLLAFVLAVVIENVNVPKPDRAQAEKIPERLAKLVMEKKKEEPPPPPPPKEEVVKEEEKPKEEPKEQKPEEVKVQKAREKAEKAMAEAKQELSALQDLAASFGDLAPQTLTRGATSGPGISRDLIGSRTGKGSAGVNLGSTSSGGGGTGIAGGGKLGGAQVAAVQSSIGEGGATGPTRKSAGGKLERTEEEVRRVMERNNGALQAIYQRALRSNPTLKGAIVLRLVIAPDGSVTSVDLVSSELGDPETEKKLLARIKAVNFGAIEGVAVWDDKYTLNFFPS